uniref:HEPN domain-containing protein n=1 Tax=candidate division WWE3 bacterium TaxID=2053526 RepID=A0A831Z128_UNCKA
MNNVKRADLLFTAAEESLLQGEFSFRRKVWNLSIRRAQEAVELSLTGILALFGVHYPKDHDQAPLAIRLLSNNGFDLGNKSQKIQEISIDLSRKRGPALHQEEGYDLETARKGLDDAKFVLTTVQEVRQALLRKIAAKAGK